MLRRQSGLAISLFCIVLANSSNVYAEGFFTIIGPDGRPMIVPGKSPAQKPQSKKPVVSEPTQADAPKIYPQNIQVKPALQNDSSKINLKPSIESKATVDRVQKKTTNEVKKSLPIELPSKTGLKTDTQSPQLGEQQQILKKEEKSVVAVNNIQPAHIVEKINKEIELTSSTDTSPASSITRIDGVDYVNNEYLEDQEFNLEGKKRFYTMPDGTGRFETIERKKGISRSMLDKMLNRSVSNSEPIVLSNQYVRLSAQDLTLAFENDQCFLENYNKNKTIRTLTLTKDVGLWPRKPLKEKFEYELVKLDSAVQYMQVDSYAASTEKPVYYWPLAVFLDEKGCVLEGVSGFKNKTLAATLLQHAGLQGVLKVPSNARYLMMTPLASAMDVPEQELSNQGQIKISALQ